MPIREPVPPCAEGDAPTADAPCCLSDDEGCGDAVILPQVDCPALLDSTADAGEDAQRAACEAEAFCIFDAHNDEAGVKAECVQNPGIAIGRPFSVGRRHLNAAVVAAASDWSA